MVYQMIGFSVSYRHDAFRTSVERDGIRRDNLEGVLEGLAQGIRRLSRGRCIITPQNGFLSKEADTPIDLVVYVPAGGDQHELILAAVNQLEWGFENLALTLPIDASLRTIEPQDKKCEMCTRASTWVRHTAFSGNHHFCTEHAEAEADFGDNSSNNMYWEQLEPVTT